MLINSSLMQWLKQRLSQTHDSVQEHELLAELRALGWEMDYSDTQKLYACHFLLYHHLYTLQKQLHPSEGMLRIECTRIQLIPANPARQNLDSLRLTGVDSPALRDFYLNPDNLHIDMDELNGWLDDFWRTMHAVTQLDLDAALLVLQMNRTDSMEAITRQYRRLSMQHHPDRNGNKEEFQAIQQAMQVVRKYAAEGIFC